MATTAKTSVPDRKPLTKAHKAKLVKALDRWRASLTDEERQELRERNRATQQARWANMSERERKERLAGVKAWQRAQKAAKRAAAKTAAKPAPKVAARKAPPKRSRAASVGESAVPAGTVEVIGPDGTSKPSKGNNVLANRRTRKAVAK